MIQEKIYSFIDILLSIALCLACIYGTIESFCHQEWLLAVIMGLSAISTLYGVFTWKKNKEPFMQAEVYMLTIATAIWWIFFFYMNGYPSLTTVCIVSSIQTLYQWLLIKRRRNAT